MFFLKICWMALRSLQSNLLRTLLATLGVIIGVSAVVSAMSILDGTNRDVLKRFGVYSTESNGHLSEYLPWYRKRPDEIGRWIDMSHWIHGETGGYLRYSTETRNYVPAILAVIIISHNQKQYGFNVQPEPEWKYEVAHLSTQTDLDVVASLCQTTPEVIQDLNPHFKRGVTPPGGSA